MSFVAGFGMRNTDLENCVGAVTEPGGRDPGTHTATVQPPLHPNGPGAVQRALHGNGPGAFELAHTRGETLQPARTFRTEPGDGTQQRSGQDEVGGWALRHANRFGTTSPSPNPSAH